MLIHKNDLWKHLSKKANTALSSVPGARVCSPASIYRSWDRVCISLLCEWSIPRAAHHARSLQLGFKAAARVWECFSWLQREIVAQINTEQHCKPMEITKGMCNTAGGWGVGRRKELESWGKAGVAVIQTEGTKGQKAGKWKSKREETKWSENSEGKEQAEVAWAV